MELVIVGQGRGNQFWRYLDSGETLNLDLPRIKGQGTAFPQICKTLNLLAYEKKILCFSEVIKKVI